MDGYGVELMPPVDDATTSDMNELRARIDEIADQLCLAVAGDFDFSVKSGVPDETLDRLALLINFLIDGARRSLIALQTKNSSLAELDQLKSDFVANVSHELRTPLTLILAPLRSLLAEKYGPLPKPVADVTERVLRNTVRLNRFVNDLLDFSKLEAGKMKASLESVEPGEVLETLLEDLRPAARERGLTVSCASRGWPSGLRALLDAKMFERIALNLVSNAFKFTPKNGAVAVSLELEGASIVLKVHDTGIGIAPEKQTLLFRRFQQIDSATNRSHQGTGLGLALVKEFAELMNGTVGVESELGAGATFIVRLPFVAPAKETREAFREAKESFSELIRIEKASKRVETPAPANVLRSTVLIVEDNEDLQSYVYETLAADYNVLTAANGKEALAILERSHPDIILSDVMMPGIDGLELLRRVKAHPNWKLIPFILLTARVSRDERLAGLDEGADDYLTKPFDAVELQTRLRAALRTRALYQELEAKNHELEVARLSLQRKIEERTYELSLQSQKAMAANKAKDQFLANMSHEMRTPLTAIIGFSDLISGGATPTESAEFLDTIRRNAQHLLSLIDEILDFSKIESGYMSIEREALDLREMVRDLEQTFRPIVDEKKIRLRISVDETVPPLVVTDAKRLLQMMTNIVGNAIKFTDKGSVRAEIQVIDDRGSSHLRIRVIDTGIGISPAAHEKLFAPFTQADMSLSRKLGGTGLGLALSRKIARSLGGELMIESSVPGQGSVFTLWFPVEIGQTATLVKRAGGFAQRARAGRRDLEGLRILLAEDSADNRRLLKRMLEGVGAQLDFVEDGVAAVERAKNGSFDVILMDIQMPKLDGFSATRLIREQGFRKPIFALTAHASEQALQRILEAGCNDRIVKPIEFDQMVSNIRASAALSGDRSQTAASSTDRLQRL